MKKKPVFGVICLAIISTVIIFGDRINTDNLQLTLIPDDGDTFGNEIGLIGDFDGDGINDIIIGASGDDDGGKDRGAVYILFLNKDGTVKEYQKIPNLIN